MARSLRFWLSLGLSTLVALAVLIVLGAVLGVLLPRLNAEVETRNLALGEVAARHVASRLDDFASDMSLLAADLAQSPARSTESRRVMVDTVAQTKKSLETLYVLDADDRVIDVGMPVQRRASRANLVGIDFSARAFVRQARVHGGPVWSDTYLSVDGRIVVALAVPLHSAPGGENNSDVVVGEFDLAELSRFASDLSQSGAVLPIILDARGQVVGHPQAVRALRQENLGHLPLLAKGDVAPPRSARFRLEEVEYIGSYTPLGTHGWGVVVAQPVDLAFATVRRTLLALAVACALALVLAMVAAVVAGRRVTRRVAEFAAQIEGIAGGDYRASLPRSTTDEIERLAQSTRRMAAAVLERESALRRSEAKYRTLIETSHDLITRVDVDGRLTFVNPMATTYFGLDPGRCIGLSAFEFVHPDDRAATETAFKGWVAAGSDEAFEFENRQVSRDNRVYLMQWCVVAELEIAGGNGNGNGGTHSAFRKVVGFSSIGRDVTAERAAKADLAESERRYRDMFLRAPLPYQSLDMDTRIIDVNDAWLALLGGYKREEVLGREITDFIEEGSCAALAAKFPEFFANGSLDGPVFEIRRKDGQRRTVTINGRIGHESSGMVRTHCILTDITDRQRAEEAQRLAATVFASSVEGICITDAERRILAVNPALESITGYSAAEVVGKTPSVFSSGRHDDEFYGRMWRAIANDGFWRGEVWNRRKDGEVFPELLTITAVRDPSGKATHYIGSLFDITESKRTETELEQYRHHLERLVEERTAALSVAKEAAEAASRAKSTFLANMSHELRTPMNAIMGMTNLMMRRTMDSKLRSQLDRIDQSSQHLLGVINNILDISKIEAERLSLEEVDFSVEDVLNNLMVLVGHKVAEKGLRLQIDATPEVGRTRLRGDPLRLGQILLNLAGNSVKFTESGSITVRLRIDALGGDAVRLRAEVQDTGIGIAVEDQARLFTAFEQADGSMTRKYGGTGLGLAISRRLARMMDGDIEFASRPGVGSTFRLHVTLRRSTVASAPAPAQRASAAEGRLQAEFAGTRILLVEDEPTNRDVARWLLEDRGLVVDQAEDGIQAVDLAGRTRYALILMDMQMPRLNGVEATRAIRALPGHERTPIVAMTANAFAEDRQVCLDAGMDDHVGKPVAPDLLFEVMLRWLTRARS